MMKWISLSLLVFTGCAHPYTLDPVTEKKEKINGIELNTLTTKKCVLQAGYEVSTPEEMLIHIRVMNKSEGDFDIDHSYFNLSGKPESIINSTLSAQEPDRYLKDLATAAENQDQRTQMESYQGIEELGTLGGDKSDQNIDAAKDLYKRKQKDAEKARKTAAAIRKRIALIQPLVLKKTTVKKGMTSEGAIIFKADFKEDGAVLLESSHPACKGELKFLLRK